MDCAGVYMHVSELGHPCLDMHRDQPSSPGTPPQWSYADLLLGRPRPASTSASTTSSTKGDAPDVCIDLPAITRAITAPVQTSTALTKDATAVMEVRGGNTQAQAASPPAAAAGASDTGATALIKNPTVNDISRQSQYVISGCVAAAAAPAPNMYSQGDKHTSLAPVRQSADYTQQHPAADAQCDRMSQEGQQMGKLAKTVKPETQQFSKETLTTSNSASTEHGQYAHAEHGLQMFSSIQAAQAPVRLHPANAELGPRPQAEHETRSAGSNQAATPLTRCQPQTDEPRQSTHDRRESVPWAGLHANASRPPHRPHVLTAEPRQSAKAEHENTLQGNAHPCQACTRPQVSDMELEHDLNAEPDSMSHVHPRGADEGDTNPNEPSIQAEQVHSLQDTLDIALQELLLTEDRGDFRQSIQVLPALLHHTNCPTLCWLNE